MVPITGADPINSANSCQRAAQERVTGDDRKVKFADYPYQSEDLMTKIIATLIAAMFAAGAVYAQAPAKKDDKPAAAPAKKDEKKAEAKK